MVAAVSDPAAGDRATLPGGGAPWGRSPAPAEHSRDGALGGAAAAGKDHGGGAAAQRTELRARPRKLRTSNDITRQRNSLAVRDAATRQNARAIHVSAPHGPTSM